jgi:hypothetical protein
MTKCGREKASLRQYIRGRSASPSNTEGEHGQHEGPTRVFAQSPESLRKHYKRASPAADREI